MKKPQNINGWLVVWEVIECDYDGNETIIVVYKDPHAAALFAATHRSHGVHMSLYKPEWFKTGKCKFADEEV